MKNILYLLAILGLITFTKCSPYRGIVPKDYPQPFQFVLMDSAKGTRDELYVKANEWIAKSFKSSKAVIEMQDKEAGKIIGKGFFAIKLLEVSTEESVYFTISIDVKEGRYRCILSDFNHEGAILSKGSTPDFGSLDRKTVKFMDFDMTDKLNYIKNKTLKESNLTLESLKKAMHANDDW